MTIKTIAGGLGAVLTLALGVSTHALAADPIVLSWQDTSLAEAQYTPIWKEMVAAFEAENPGIKIDPQPVGRQDKWPKFVAAAQAGQAACIVSVDIPTAADLGYLLPLDDMWNAEPDTYRSVWSKGGIGTVTYKDHMYGLPFYAGIYGEVYNRALVTAAGLNPDAPPKTWDEYLTWAKALTGTDHWATAVLGGPTDTTTRVLLSWIYSNGGRAFNDDLTEATFAKDPKSLAAIKFYIELATKQGVSAPSPATNNYNEQTIMFAQSKIATMRNAYWGIAKVLGDSPQLKPDIFVTAPPANDPDARSIATVSTISVSANCQHPKEAWEFLKYMTGPKWAVKMVAAANWMPLRNDIMDAPEVTSDPIVQKFLEMGDTALTVPLPTPAWTQIASKDVVAAVQEALQHPDNIDQIFTDLDTLVTEHLNDN